ncbi:MAG TPA: hypothetical protein VK153_03410 [Candidatus Paceibacterota bacterium]|nr:hypothetical protein [Candidatus Paceibacterota bacterium]
MSYIDDELKIDEVDVDDEEDEEEVEDDFNPELEDDIPVEDDLLDDEFIGLSDTDTDSEY